MKRKQLLGVAGLVTILCGALSMAAEKSGITLPEELVPAGAKVERIVEGRQFTEGAQWMKEPPGGVAASLIFSDTPADTMYRWNDAEGLKVFRQPAHHSNGNTLDRQGRLITCEHGMRRVVREEKDGTITVLADSYQGKKLNSPNDVVVKSDGTIFFTDPPYGLEGRPKEQAHNFVFRLNPETKELTPAVSDFVMPNGLCFSPDEKKLYIADSGRPHHVRVFDVGSDNALSGGKVFCVIDKGVPDGMRCDAEGRLWSSSGDGVQVFSPDGNLLGRILVPETPANLSFGGKDGTTLYMTARTGVYRVETKVHAPPGR